VALNASALQKLTIARGIGRIGTWRWDAATDRLEEYGLWMDLLGYGPGQLLHHSRDLLDYVHPDDINAMRRAHVTCVRGEAAEYDVEHRLRAADGTYRWVLSRGRVTARDAAGRTQVMEGVYVDLTRFKATEEALRVSQRFLRLVLDTIPVRVFWKDTAGRYLGCNRAFARDVGLIDTDAVAGLTDADLSWTAHAEAYRADDRLVMEGGHTHFQVQRPVTNAAG
jgi:PAS domain S-box-containing protein